MKKTLSLVACLMSFTLLAAPAPWRNGERQPLWPEGRVPDFQPHQVGAMTDEAGGYPKKPKAGFDAAAHRMPYLEWFAAPAEKPARGCMILVSGGSYNHCCDVELVKAWRDTFTKLGFQCVNLVYRTPRAKGLPCYQSAWEDGQRAVRLVRRDAAKRGFDPEKIGAIGMSAGGHLVCMLATSALTPAYARVDETDDIPCHINWAIANAPAYNTATAADGVPRPQDGTTFTDLKVNPCFKFDAKTCPISFHHGGKDPWTPNGSTQCYRELRKLKIPAELHLYADKPHGAFGIERAIEFMRQMNFDGRLGREVSLLKRFPSDKARGVHEKEPVWPEGKMPDAQANQCAPYLEWHFPKKLGTKAIQIIYSGGGYTGNNPDGFEVAPARRVFNERGMTVVTMKYRCPNKDRSRKHVAPWQDLQRTIRIVRSKAAAKGLDPNRIGIMGSSAGGHLTLMGATSSTVPAYEPIDELDKIPCNVQWAVAIYPAYALTDGVDRPNARGGNFDDAVPVPEFAFDKATCPMVFIHVDADGWAAMNSVKCWEKLRSMGVQCDLHTLATRGHCFQRKAAPGTGSYTWIDQVWDFVSRKGFNK